MAARAGGRGLPDDQDGLHRRLGYGWCARHPQHHSRSAADQQTALELNDGFLDGELAKRAVKGPVLKANVGLATAALRLVSGDRAGPADLDEVANFTKARVLCDAGYLPGSLRGVWRKIIDAIDRLTLDQLLPPRKAATKEDERDAA